MAKFVAVRVEEQRVFGIRRPFEKCKNELHEQDIEILIKSGALAPKIGVRLAELRKQDYTARLSVCLFQVPVVVISISVSLQPTSVRVSKVLVVSISINVSLQPFRVSMFMFTNVLHLAQIIFFLTVDVNHNNANQCLLLSAHSSTSSLQLYGALVVLLVGSGEPPHWGKRDSNSP